MNDPKPITVYQIPPSVPMTFCRSCKASIYWVKTPLGKLCPVDAALPTRGQSHFRTCPHAREHSKKGKG